MDLSSYTEFKPHRFKRMCWAVINTFIFPVLARPMLWPMRRWILRKFGARIDAKAYIYESSQIFAPWNLIVGRACIGPHTRLYNKDRIQIGNDSVISQGAFLCTASHDISSRMLPLITRPIIIGDNVWIASDCFIGPGVTVAEGCVLGARACLFKSTARYEVLRGNPAITLKQRIIKDA